MKGLPDLISPLQLSGTGIREQIEDYQSSFLGMQYIARHTHPVPFMSSLLNQWFKPPSL